MRFCDKLTELISQYEDQHIVCGHCGLDVVSAEYPDGSGWGYYNLKEEQMYCEKCYNEKVFYPKAKVETKSDGSLKW